MEKKRKPFYIIFLSIVVVCLMIYQSTIIISRINKVALEYMLAYINDLASLIFLLVFLNKSIRAGALLYFFSFICFLVLQFVFSTKINTGIIVVIGGRFIAVLFLFYSWFRTIVKKDTTVIMKR